LGLGFFAQVPAEEGATTFSINDTKHNGIQQSRLRVTILYSAQALSPIMLCFSILIAIMLNVIWLSVIMTNIIILSVVVLSAVMLNFIILYVVMLNVVMLTDVMPDDRMSFG